MTIQELVDQLVKYPSDTEVRFDVFEVTFSSTAAYASFRRFEYMIGKDGKKYLDLDLTLINEKDGEVWITNDGT